MGAKIDAALGAVKPGSKCNACVVVGGHDLDAIRGTVGSKVFFEAKGTLFATVGTQLFEIAAKEVEPLVVSLSLFYVSLPTCYSFMRVFQFSNL
jgi:hypothetical protein